ncbi:unnamed protein product [Symbiodinium necroappetens]|uniref:Uncharacterized protein n=1 Tax=Symbiodinium necroappetens TaxID=1628268 RepID=A0A812NLT4_9DINO|nr:unnamed protein product [Symbiodinium necroappetens]
MPLTDKVATLLAAAEEMKKRALKGSSYDHDHEEPTQQTPKTPTKDVPCKVEKRTPGPPVRKACKLEHLSPAAAREDAAVSVVSGSSNQGTPHSKRRSGTPHSKSKKRRTSKTPTPTKDQADTVAATQEEPPEATEEQNPDQSVTAANPEEAQKATTPGKRTPDKALKAASPEETQKAATPGKRTPDKAVKAASAEETQKAATPGKRTPDKAVKAASAEETQVPTPADRYVDQQQNKASPHSVGKRPNTPREIRKMAGKAKSSADARSVMFEDWLQGGENWKSSKLLARLRSKSSSAGRGMRKWLFWSEMVTRFGESVAQALRETKEADPERSLTEIRKWPECEDYVQYLCLVDSSEEDCDEEEFEQILEAQAVSPEEAESQKAQQERKTKANKALTRATEKIKIGTKIDQEVNVQGMGDHLLEAMKLDVKAQAQKVQDARGQLQLAVDRDEVDDPMDNLISSLTAMCDTFDKIHKDFLSRKNKDANPEKKAKK